ncbi:hypothetical protein HDU97_000036 [Phlyctochytrium planicorne]|nr:hypothetical protein HDU97_000036 [Phlyctochytrium planicorne]
MADGDGEPLPETDAARIFEEKHRKERLAVALFELIERERERENAIKRQELAEKIKRQHVKIGKGAEVLQQARIAREDAVVKSRQDFLQKKRKELVSIHSPLVHVHGEREIKSGSNKISQTSGKDKGAPSPGVLSLKRSNDDRTATLTRTRQLGKPVMPNSSLSLAFDGNETGVSDMQASKMSLLAGGGGLRSANSPLTSAAPPYSKSPLPLGRARAPSHAESLTTAQDGAPVNGSEAGESYDMERWRTTRPKRLFRGDAYKKQVELMHEERDQLNIPVIPRSKRYHMTVGLPRKRRPKSQASAASPTPGNPHHEDKEKRQAKNSHWRVELDPKEIIQMNKKKFKGITGKIHSKVPPASFKEHGGLKIARSRCVSERRDRHRHKAVPPNAAVVAVFQTEASFKEFKSRYQRPFTAEKREDMDSIETVKGMFSKRLNRKRHMWEQAQKNRHRTLTFSYGGGTTGDHAIDYSRGILGASFGNHLLHNAPKASVASDESRPPSVISHDTDAVFVSQAPEKPSIDRRASSVMGMSQAPTFSADRRASSALGWLGSGGTSGIGDMPIMAGERSRLSPVSQGRSATRASQASTERSLEIAMSMANSKLASSRRGGLLSAIRDETSTRATSSRAPLGNSSLSIANMQSSDPELRSNRPLSQSPTLDNAASPAPPTEFEADTVNRGEIKTQDPLARLFEDSSSPKGRVGSGGLAKGATRSGSARIGSAGRVTFQKHTDSLKPNNREQHSSDASELPKLPEAVKKRDPHAEKEKWHHFGSPQDIDDIPETEAAAILKSSVRYLETFDFLRKSKEVPLGSEALRTPNGRFWEPLGQIALAENSKTLRATNDPRNEAKPLGKLRMRPMWAPGKPVFSTPFEEPSRTNLADVLTIPSIMRVWTGETDYDNY